MRFLFLAVFLLSMLSKTCCVQSNPRSVSGIYRNPAEGYSIRIPQGLKANAGDQAGPERGVNILLPTGNTIFTVGEPNSAEYKDPVEGMWATLGREDCQPREVAISTAKIGKLTAAKGGLTCGHLVHIKMLAFRPHGGPIYWLHLETDLAHEHDDEVVLEAVAASFRIIRWK